MGNDEKTGVSPMMRPLVDSGLLFHELIP